MRASAGRRRAASGSDSSGEPPRRSSARSTGASAERFGPRTACSSPIAPRAAGPLGSRSSSAVVPFALGVVDLIVRGRRRGLPFAPAIRAQRCSSRHLGLRCAPRLDRGARADPSDGRAAAAAAVRGVPRDAARLRRARSRQRIRARLARHPPAARPRRDARRATSGSRGSSSRLRCSGSSPIGLAVFQPYALVFVLPSLYAWLWLPLEARLAVRVERARRRARRARSSGLVLLGRELGLSVLDAALYVVGLFTVGYLPLGSALLGSRVGRSGQRRSARSRSAATRRTRVESATPPAGPVRRSFARLR